MKNKLKSQIPKFSAKRLWLLVIAGNLVFGVWCLPKAHGLETSSGSYSLDSVTFMSGGGPVASANIDSVLGIGECTGAVSESSSANYSSIEGQLNLIFSLLRWKKIKVISDLKASTESLGSPIPEAVWQKDDDPYFSWTIEVKPESLLSGFSVSLDAAPLYEINTAVPNYQFSENTISSGKHIFYVLPFSSDKGWEEDSLLKFEIWVDTVLPLASSLQPAPGTITASKAIPITCALYDEHSGLDLSASTVTINNNSVNFSYDIEKRLLTIDPGTALSEGKNTILLKAYDIVGNYIVKGWDFILDTQHPLGSIKINAGEKITYSAYVFINIKVEDVVSGIKNIYLSNDGVFDTELEHPLTYAPVIYNWLLLEPDVDGRKTVYARFQDWAGNLSDTYTAQIELKRLTPDTWIISGPAGITEKTEADFIYDATKAGCLFNYKLDNQEWSGWSSSSAAHFSGLTQGNHYFYVKSAFDLNQDGNITIDEEDSTPAQWVWTVKPAGYLEKLRQRILFWKR